MTFREKVEKELIERLRLAPVFFNPDDWDVEVKNSKNISYKKDEKVVRVQNTGYQDYVLEVHVEERRENFEEIETDIDRFMDHLIDTLVKVNHGKTEELEKLPT